MTTREFLSQRFKTGKGWLMAKTRTAEGKLNWETKAALGLTTLVFAACGYLGLRELAESESPDLPETDPRIGEMIDARIFGQDQVFFTNMFASQGLRVTGATEVLPIPAELGSDYRGMQIVGVETKDSQSFTYILTEDQQGEVTQNFVVWLADKADSSQVTAYKLKFDAGSNSYQLQEVNGGRLVMGSGRINPASGELWQAALVLPDGKIIQADRDWLDQLLGVQVAEAAEAEAATATATPTPFPTLTRTPTPTATATIELTPTPETVIVPENQEYKIPQQPVIIEDSLPGVDLELSPSARPKAIYDTIAASMSRFLKKEENINLIGAEAWETMMAKYPGLLMRSPQDLRLEAVTDFLTLSKGVIYIDFFGGRGYPKSGWINANLGFKFQLGHTNTPFPPEYAVGGYYLHPQTLTKTPGLWVKVYASEEGQLTFSILSLPDHKADELNYELFYQMDEADYWSRRVAYLVESQADQFRNGNLDNPQNNITNPDLFVTDWVGQDGRYFVDPFLKVVRPK